jgi:hypothetical protein
MSSIRSLRRRIDKIEHDRNPPPSSVPPFHIIDRNPHIGTPQAEIDRIRAEVEDWKRTHPAGPPAFLIDVAWFGDDA